MLRLLACLVLALPLVAVDAERLLAVLAEAEQAGFPRLTDAQLYRGLLMPQGRAWNWMRQNAARAAEEHVHARLPDGSWLIDLVVPMPAADADPDAVAALSPVDRPTGRPPAWPGHHAGTTILIAARWLQLRPDDITRAAVLQLDGDLARLLADMDGQVAVYPRRRTTTEPESRLRWALATWFLGEGPCLSERPSAGAVAIAPTADREAIAQLVARRQAPPVVWDGDAQLLAAWQPERRRGRAVVLPDLDEGRLLALADDPRAVGTNGQALGDIALAVLAECWGVDPAVVAGRSPEAPWTDAERRAVTEGAKQWWRSGTGQPLVEHLAAAVAQALPDDLVLAVQRRDAWRMHRGDRMANDLAFTRPILAALATRWADGLPTMRPESLQAILRWARADQQPDLVATIDRWQPAPWSHELLAVWADGRGRQQAVDALVAAWLADPSTDSDLRIRQPFVRYLRTAGESPASLTPLTYWVCRPDAHRWQRLTALVAADPATDRAASRLLAAVGSHWYGEGNDVGAALAWLALADRRPATAELIARAQTRLQRMRATGVQVPFAAVPAEATPVGWRICDTVAWQIIAEPFACLDYQTVTDLAQHEPNLPTALAAADPAARDAAIGQVRALVATAAHASLTAAGLPILDGLTPPTPQAHAAGTTALAVSPGLTSDEATACQAVLRAAQAAGFPDLAGAHATQGELVAGSGVWFGPHLRLGDGSWLADGLVPIVAEAVRAGGTPLLPIDDHSHVSRTRLAPADRARVAVNDRLGSCAEHPEVAGLIALAWWLSGADPAGNGLIAAAAAAEAADVDRPGRMPIAVSMYTHAGEGTVIPMPDPATAVRRTCARWFREQLRLAADDAAAARWAAAARGILEPADLPVWEPSIAGLLAVRRISVPAQAAGLDARLAAWPDQGRDQRRGTWEPDAPAVPARLGDLDGLVALLADDRPSRWIEGGLPRSIGDNALRALASLTGVDWRWLVIDDPQVAIVAPPPDREVGDHTRWHRWAWDAAQRRAVAAALNTWWAAHREQGPSAAVAGVIARLPLVQWDDVLTHIPARFIDATTGAAVARRIAPWRMPIEDVGPLAKDPPWTVIRACLRWHSDTAVTAAIAGWPAAPWRDRLQRLRNQLGDGTAFDADLDAFCAGRLAIPREGDGSWDWRISVDPAYNVGLWAHAPTAPRLAALRTCLAGSLDDGPALWLLAQLGYGRLPVCGGWEETDRFTAGRPTPYAIPAALALMALEDQRPIPVARIQRLAEMTSYDREATEMTSLRVCDWVAYRVLQGHQRLGLGRLPEGVGSTQTMLHAPPAARDRVIIALHAALAPVVEDHLIEAGLAPRPADLTPNF